MAPQRMHPACTALSAPHAVCAVQDHPACLTAVPLKDKHQGTALSGVWNCTRTLPHS